MACKNCFDNNCNGEVISDVCVKYTGEDNDFLGICSGDKLTDFEYAVIQKLEEISTGKGITLEDLTSDCSSIIDTIGSSDKALSTIIQIMLDEQCSLRQLAESINNIVGGSFSLTSSCIDFSGNPNLANILQLISNKICTVSSTVDTIASDYVKSSELASKIQEYLNSQNSGGTSTVQYSDRMVPYVAMPYHGTLSNFDSNGVGYSSTGFSNIYICNGSNGTPDYRGRSPMGSNVNVPGNSMGTDTNPTLNNNAAYGLSLNGTMGSYKDTLTIAQTPAHVHTVTDNGHVHNIVSVVGRNESGAFKAFVQQGSTISFSTDSAKSNITINSAGGGQYHNTTHPVIGANFIMYIPS